MNSDVMTDVIIVSRLVKVHNNGHNKMIFAVSYLR